VRVLGVDPSSSSTGLALVDGERLVDSAVWKPTSKMTRPDALLDYEDSLSEWLVVGPFDLAVVEELSVTRGWKTVRALAHFEAVTYVALARRRIPMITIKPGAARNWVLEMDITSSKEEVHAEVKRRWPDLRLPRVDQGGGDVADAYVMALAGPEALRRGH
jgi:Holliday junction resolvasome RuvABC endonuclease subunit